MIGGLTDLSAEYFSDVLSQARGSEVIVHSVRVMDYADSPDNIRGAAGLRKVDLSTSDGPVSLMVKLLGLNRKREAEVWRFLVDAGDMPIPTVYRVELDAHQGNYGVVTEFLAPLEEAHACGPEVCGRVGRALAALHGRWWGRTDEVPAFLPMPEHPAETRAAATARRFIDSLPEADRAVLYETVPEVFSLMVSVLRMPPEFFAEPTEMPRTVIHGALDRSEVLFRPSGEGPEPVLIDWESARRGRCTEDLAGLINSLPPDVRAAGRDAMVGAYIETLSHANVGLQTGYLQERIDSRRVMMAVRDLPGLCRTYLQRKDDPAHEQWCTWFLGRAGKDIAEIRRLLDQLKAG